MNLKFWLRWSWRDLRARWLQVVAIAVIISFGTGVFAGLGGQETWRKNSYDLSYGNLNMYDIQVEFADGSYVDQAELENALADVDGVAVLETRLITETLVDASHDDEFLVTKGRIVGVDVSDGGPHVNGLFVDDESGRTLTNEDAGTLAAVVEYKFAKANNLEVGAPIRVSGDVELDFVGAGHSPEYFLVIGEGYDILGAANYGVVFVSLETAQELAGREGLVNDAAMLVEDGADIDGVTAEVETRMAESFPDVGITIMHTEDDPIYPLIYADAENDQNTWNTVAILFMIGAALGAFNLAGRMVDAQRREIGIGMALGVPRKWLAFRPMLVGVQIAVLGTIFGLFIGVGIGTLFAAALRDLVPMPYYNITFYMPGYIVATLVGIGLPFIATLIPVWRAVRVPPVDAITTGHLVAKGGGLMGLAKIIPIPGKSFIQMPVKNILRSPWRTLMTALGISIAIMLMVAIVGFVDSFAATLQGADDAYRYEGDNRYIINLNFFYPQSNGEVTAISELTTEDGTLLFSDVDTNLMLGGTLMVGDESIETAIELYDMGNSMWQPKLIEGQWGAINGLVISEKAATDLGLVVGDTLILEHPSREGLLSFKLVQTEVTVIGIHDNPLRPLTYMEMTSADMMGLSGTTNMLTAMPNDDVTDDDVKEALLGQPGVISVRQINEFSEALETMMGLIAGMMVVVQGIVIVMSFLIAFNSTSISVDERAREIATMFAFGLPIRTVTRMQMLENFIIGALGTFIGIALGWLVIVTVFANLMAEQVPDFKFVIDVAPNTILLAATLGVMVVALTPLLSVRRMRKMDLPSTLRVME